MLTYDEVITVAGVRIPFVPSIITPLTETPLREGRYEAAERRALRSCLRPGDRVLELGGGIGFLSALAALTPGVRAVTTVEANPRLIPLIRETHRLNGLEGGKARVIKGAVTADAGEDIDFFIRRHFRGSSLDPNLGTFARSVKQQRIAIAPLLEKVRPTVIVCDIEGGEDGLFDAADLSGVHHIVIELHPKAYGDDGMDRVLSAFATQGLFWDEALQPTPGNVVLLGRRQEVSG